MTIKIDLLPGTSIDKATASLVEMAILSDSVIIADFNGFELRADPSSVAVELCKEYKAFCDRRSQEYKNSAEGKAAEAKSKEEALAKLHAAPKEFPIEVVLSVITGRLLTKPGSGNTKNGIGALYDFIGHCLASDCFDIVSPRMANELRPLLIERFPELQIALEQEDELEELLDKEPDVLGVISLWIDTLGLPEIYLVPVLVNI